MPPYHDEPVYIDALARSIEQHLATLDCEPEVVLASYHGIPKSYFEKGDPYHCHCQKTTRLLRERLGWDDEEADHHLPVALRRAGMAAALYRQDGREAGQGRRQVDRHHQPRLLGPTASRRWRRSRGEAAEIFHHAGGEKFAHIPCLNDSDEGMEVIETLVRRELSGWACNSRTGRGTGFPSGIAQRHGPLKPEPHSPRRVEARLRRIECPANSTSEPAARSGPPTARRRCPPPPDPGCQGRRPRGRHGHQRRDDCRGADSDGHSVICIDRRGPLIGSTPATTALVQFEIDQPLSALSTMIGVTKAERAWRRSRLAVANLAGPHRRTRHRLPPRYPPSRSIWPAT